MSTSTANLDMALDDVIKQKRPSGRGRSRGGNNSFAPRRGGGITKTSNGPTRQGLRSAGAQSRAQPYSNPRATGLITTSGGEGSKILISNLDFNVTEADLKELFETRVGPLRRVALNYDATGKSKGSATIQFSRARDAAVAYDKYHNVTLDGRAMKIEILLNPTAALLARPALAAPIIQNTRMSTHSGQRGGSNQRGRGRGRGGKRTGETRKPKTAEELDQEMSEYMNVDDGPST